MENWENDEKEEIYLVSPTPGCMAISAGATNLVPCDVVSVSLHHSFEDQESSKRLQ